MNKDFLSIRNLQKKMSELIKSGLPDNTDRVRERNQLVHHVIILIAGFKNYFLSENFVVFATTKFSAINKRDAGKQKFLLKILSFF